MRRDLENDSLNIVLTHAQEFAEKKHEGILRKYTGEPYASHCHNVAMTVYMYTGCLDSTIAAYIHDTLEDTDTTYKEIVENFGKKVADIVIEVTKIKHKGMTRKQVHEWTLERLREASVEAQNIKIADINDNLATYKLIDNAAFAALYLKEKREQRAVLTKGCQELQDLLTKRFEGLHCDAVS